MATDLDVVHARNRENIARLLSALAELEAVYRVQPEQQLRPAESHLSSSLSLTTAARYPAEFTEPRMSISGTVRLLPRAASPGHQLLLTKFGPLDVLAMIGKSRTWEDLLPHTRTMEIEPGVDVRVLDLETLIAVKEELGFPKDTAVLPVLRQTLKQRSERQHWADRKSSAVEFLICVTSTLPMYPIS